MLQKRDGWKTRLNPEGLLRERGTVTHRPNGRHDMSTFLIFHEESIAPLADPRRPEQSPAPAPNERKQTAADLRPTDPRKSGGMLPRMICPQGLCHGSTKPPSIGRNQDESAHDDDTYIALDAC
jgi:hypothetical protein